MNRHPVVFRRTAQADLQAIFSYVLDRSCNADIARNYVRRIRNKCQEIGDAPLAHPELPEIFPGLRMAVFERRIVILYTVENGTIRIVSILSGSRDYAVLIKRITSSPPP